MFQKNGFCIAFSFLLLLLLSFCSDLKEKNSLDEYFQSQIKSDEPGGAILIMKGDSVLFSKGYGLADLQTRELITPNTLFNIGSISKTFVANAILILESQGKLSVEDSLIKYFPDFVNKDMASKIKIKHLLTHTSGLPDNRNVSADTVFYLTAKDAESWAPILKTEKLNFEPGSQFEYSNPAYNGLALIVEKVSGQKWQEFVIENIMKPAGMKTSTITDGPHPKFGVSHAYVLNHGQWIEDDYGEEPTFAAAGNGGVWSSVEELSMYELAIKNHIFLTNEKINESRTIKVFDIWSPAATDSINWSWFRPSENSQPFIGWSWFIGETHEGLKTIGHTGSQGGFIANYATLPEQDIFFVILCNSPRDIYIYSDQIISWLRDEKLL